MSITYGIVRVNYDHYRYESFHTIAEGLDDARAIAQQLATEHDIPLTLTCSHDVSHACDDGGTAHIWICPVETPIK